MCDLYFTEFTSMCTAVLSINDIVLLSTVKTANGTYLSQYIFVFVVTCGSDPVNHISEFFIVEFSFVSGTTEFSMSRQHCYVGIAS